MTTCYDPKDARYLDEADVRAELTRVFDICNGCRRCVDLCSVFPTLFELLDRLGDHDAGRLTPAQQDRVADECVQCKRCHDNCPYTPDRHVLRVDFPRLVLRTEAMQLAAGLPTLRSRLRLQIAGRADLVGRLATSMSSLVNKLGGVQPPFAERRFSSWFAEREDTAASEGPATGGGDAVTLFPTCLVEYRLPHIGRELVAQMDANGVACTLTTAGCCGAPWLHAGDIAHFTKVARRNVETLAAEIGGGTDVVVAHATCRHVIGDDYPDYVDDPDVDLVAAHTFDAVEFLAR